MIPKAFDDIKKEDIDALVANQVREGREIEYKKELPTATDEGKREFLGDASSFANASGGDLIFGVAANDGIPIAAEGVSALNADQLMLQLESIVRDNLDPRLLGLRTKVISGFNNGLVVVMRIQRSWAAPHMITFKNVSRFFTRNSAGKHQMDVTEIRSAFLFSEGVADRVRRFRERRLAMILSEDTPVPLESASVLALHLIPITDHLLTMQRVNIGTNFSPIGEYTRGSRHNIDGFVTHEGSAPKCRGYCQVFRNGALEAVTCNFTSYQDVPLTLVEENITESLKKYLPSLDSLGVPFPLVCVISLLGVKGKGLPSQGVYLHGMGYMAYDRDQVYLPDVLIEDPKSDVARIMKPVYDAMWQGIGVPQSINYDKNGNWVRGAGSVR